MCRCGLDRMRDRMLGGLGRRTHGRCRADHGRMRSNAMCGRLFRSVAGLCRYDARTGELRRMRCCGDRRMPVVARCREIRCAGGSGDMPCLLRRQRNVMLLPRLAFLGGRLGRKAAGAADIADMGIVDDGYILRIDVGYAD